METEIWKSHPYIAGIEVSTFGRVRSVNGHYYKSNHTNDGYLKVQFYMNGKNVNKRVHRLVAETFLSNPDNLPMVNHRIATGKITTLKIWSFALLHITRNIEKNLGKHKEYQCLQSI